MSTGWLDGKVALVTGGSAGIGRAIVERFVAEGARVCAMSRSRDRLGQLRDALGGASVAVAAGDVTRLEDNARAVEAAVAAFGRLDVLVANAGIFDCFAPLEGLAPEVMDRAFDEIFAVNVKGCLFAAKAALPALRAAGGGSIIFSASQASFYPDGGGPIYTASKHALVGLIRQLAFELAPRIRVNGVAPGGTVTEIAGPPSLADWCARRKMGEERAESIRRRNPLGLAQQPEDHTASYVLLASDQSKAITGAVIESDGGLGIRGLTGPRTP
jgi:NAD(P)-dependent dehydrogenase (short-subunit alcohol dehydrogenase family)